MTAAIYSLQTKKETQFICSACGADRACDCNAPAVERLAEIREKARQEKRRQREKINKNNDPVWQTDDQSADPIQEECTDCNTDEERWQRSFASFGGDAVSMRAYWTRQFGNWEKFEVSSELITLAKQAAKAWKELADQLED